MAYEYKAVIAEHEYFDADIYSAVAENCTMARTFEIGNVISGMLKISLRRGVHYSRLLDSDSYPLSDIYGNALYAVDSDFDPEHVIPRMANVDFYIREMPVPVRLLDSEDYVLFDSESYALTTTDESYVDDWRDKGKYYIAKRTTSSDGSRLNLECYDIIRSFEAPFLVYGSQPDWPMPMRTAISIILDATGLELDTRFPLLSFSVTYSLDYPNERTIREVLGDIASAHAGNFIITDEGLLRLVPAYLIGAEYNIGRVAMRYDGKNHPFLISRVIFFWGDGEDEYFAAGDDGGIDLIVENPSATQQMVNDVYQKLSGMEYVPYETSKAFIDPFFELGDKVVVDEKERSINAYRMYYSREIATDLANPSDDEIDDEFEFLGNMRRAVNRSLKDGASYYGVSITRRNGIQIKRTDNKSEMTMNSDTWQVSVNGQQALYIDYLSTPPKMIFNGEIGVNAMSPIDDQFAQMSLTVQGLNVTVGNQAGQISSLQQTIDGFTLTAYDYGSYSQLRLTSGGITLASTSISLSGMVTFYDLATPGMTTISGGNITTGYLSADRIWGGTLSGIYIDITTDSYIGNNLFMGLGLSGASTIYFGTSGMYMKGDPVSGALEISYGGYHYIRFSTVGIYLNGNIYVNGSLI